MNDISTKVKKDNLNLFQKLRLAMFKRNNRVSFERYQKAPVYIKKDTLIINRLLRQEELSEEQLLQIPEQELLSTMNKNILERFSMERKIEFLKKKATLIDYYQGEQKYELIKEAIENGEPSLAQYLNNQTQEAEFLRYLKSQGKLEQNIDGFVTYLTDKTVKELTKYKPNLIQNLQEDRQKKMFQEQPNLFQYVDPKLQVEYIKEHPNYIPKASIKAKEIYVELDKRNLSKLDIESQIEMIKYHPEMYPDISYLAQRKIFDNPQDDKCMQATISLLKKDIRNSKYLKFLEDSHKSLKDNGKQPLYQLFEGIENWENTEIKNNILHSKITSAIGKLSKKDYAFHGITGGEEIGGIDGYDVEQIEILQKLTTSQICELIRIDNNYVLPYLASSGIQTLTQEERRDSQKRCETLFLERFGEENLEKYRACINSIYDMQMEKNELIKKRDHDDVGKIIDYSCFKAKGEIPLEEFKLLFNEQVIQNNSPKQIEDYLQEKSQGKDTGKLFREIIQRAYGDTAKEILESRPNLNIHSINSLEVFDDRILGRFGESFTHDCISYNIRDFSEFLDVIKNPSKTETFQIYYDSLTAIYGENVETMQKAISEFFYVEELLENAKEVEITDRQYQNLASVICSIRNPLNINTLQQLEHYDEIANKDLKKQMENFSREGNGLSEEIKEKITESFFGIRYRENYDITYGDSVEFMNSMYDLQEDERKKEIYTTEEQKMLEVLEFLKKEKSIPKLIEWANILMEEEGIRNPSCLQSAIRKTKEEQTNILNESFLTIDKLEKQCQNEQGKEDPNAYKEEIDGVTVYHLTGIPYTFLGHSANAEKEDIINYEGQAGNSAICCRKIDPEVASMQNQFLYMHVDDNMLISSDEEDAKTQHISKRVKNTGIVKVKAKDIPNIKKHGNEAAFYRRYRSHNKVNSKNMGGKRLPDAYGIENIIQFTEDVKEFCRKYDIPVIIKHGDKYKEKESINMDKEDLER